VSTIRVAHGRPLVHDFTVPAPGEAWAALTLTAPGTSWERGDAAVVSLAVDGAEPQHAVLAAADDVVEYARLLGRLEAGPHRLTIDLDPALSAASAREVECRGIEIRTVADEDPGAFVWRHAPVLHYRTLDSRLDGATTDTPLVVFHRPVETHEGRGVEYHVINSHEDAGTDLTGLLACWGHTTDIEWLFRVVRDACGRIVREEFQGPGHATVPFRGARTLGGHPVLQAATRNGMVTDRAASPYRAALAPVAAQPPDEPREGVQFRYPWIQRVSALEVVRQELRPHEPPGGPDAPADPLTYVYIQLKREADAAAAALEARVLMGGVWRGSASGRADLAMHGDDAECTAVKLPRGAGQEDVEAIAVRVVGPAGGEAPPAIVHFVRAFCLDDRYYPRAPFAAERAVCRLSANNPEATVWRRRMTQSL
jgi:hypothetical protein